MRQLVLRRLIISKYEFLSGLYVKPEILFLAFWWIHPRYGWQRFQLPASRAKIYTSPDARNLVVIQNTRVARWLRTPVKNVGAFSGEISSFNQRLLGNLAMIESPINWTEHVQNPRRWKHGWVGGGSWCLVVCGLNRGQTDGLRYRYRMCIQTQERGDR